MLGSIEVSRLWLRPSRLSAHSTVSGFSPEVVLPFAECQFCAQVCKVYIGSFNADVPVRTDLNPHGAELFAHEQADLLQDLYEIPQRSCDRKARPPHSRAGL